MKTVLLLALLLGSSALAQEPASYSDLLTRLRNANAERTRFGERAKANAKSPDVKAFGEKLIKDHADLEAAITEYARAQHIDTRAPQSSKAADTLATLHGTQFDVSFLSVVAAGNTEELNLIELSLKRYDDVQLHRLLNRVLATYREHVREVSQLWGDLVPAA